MKIYTGDSLKKMRTYIKDNSIDALITDPPAGIGLMGKEWDKDKGGRDEWIKWLSSIMKEAYRVMKPGAHGLVWSFPRTSHWTMTALENAGFEIRDVVVHLFGSGFPKSHNVGLAVDKLNGVESPTIDKRIIYGNAAVSCKEKGGTYVSGKSFVEKSKEIEYKKATNEWKGYGTALKPAAENWILIRKPISEKSIAENVLKHGTGAINIDSCRVGYISYYDKKHQHDICKGSGTFFGGKGESKSSDKQPQGRFPANVVLSCSCPEENFKTNTKKMPDVKEEKLDTNKQGWGFKRVKRDDIVETVGQHQPDCVCAMLDEQSGQSKPRKARSGKKGGNGGALGEFGGSTPDYMGYWCADNGGGASRFFKQIKDAPPRFIYKPKVSSKERHIGFTKDEIKKTGGNLHPTLKSIGLMTYLITLITPPNGVVLDPFMGSGSTGMAAKKLGYKFIGIEKEKEYVKIAKKRIKAIRKPK